MRTRANIAYLRFISLSVLIYLVSLVAVLNYLGFESKAQWALYIVGTIGMSSKALVFGLPILLGLKNAQSNSKILAVAFLPFVFYLTWFTTIISFSIDQLQFDISYGYLSRFPHFYLQLVSIFIICVVVYVSEIRRRRKIN